MISTINKNKSFRSYFWRSAIWTLGLPFGLTFGFIIIMENNGLACKGISDRNLLLFVISSFFTGFLFAYLYGRSRWKGKEQYDAKLIPEEQE